MTSTEVAPPQAQSWATIESGCRSLRRFPMRCPVRVPFHRQAGKLASFVQKKFFSPCLAPPLRQILRNQLLERLGSAHEWPTSFEQRLVKTGGRLVKHARYYWWMLAESHLTRRLFGSMVRRGPEGTPALAAPTG